jgi:hypothetical protein
METTGFHPRNISLGDYNTTGVSSNTLENTSPTLTTSSPLASTTGEDSFNVTTSDTSTAVSDIITDAYNISTTTTVDQDIANLMSNITEGLGLDLGNTTTAASTSASAMSDGNFTLTQNVTTTYSPLDITSSLTTPLHSTESETSTFSIIVQTLKDSVSSILPDSTTTLPPTVRQTDSNAILTEPSEHISLTTIAPEEQFTPMQKWFIATGALLGAVIILWFINCCINCKDSMMREFENLKHERRAEREMGRDSGDPTRAHLFMHPFLSK